MAAAAAARRNAAEQRRKAIADWDSSYLANGEDTLRCCPRGHILESKETQSLVSQKSCSRCQSGFSFGCGRHSCSRCEYHLCHDCLNAAKTIWRWEKRSLGQSCPSGHKLQQKECAGGLSVDKVCKRCGESHGMSPGCVRHSCKACEYHLCQPCYNSTVRSALPKSQGYSRTAREQGSHCPFGHPLLPKIVDGSHSMFRLSPPKECRVCKRELTSGMTRHSCKTCEYHLCDLCKNAKSASATKLAAGASADRVEDKSVPEVVKTQAAAKQHSLWDLFRGYDRSKSSYLSQDEFARLEHQLKQQYGVGIGQNGWIRAGGEKHGFVNFVRFCSWAQSLGLHLKVGLDTSLSKSLRAFKSSNGLLEINDESFLQQCQTWLSRTHKVDDNWTRDRGCAIHGVNGCDLKCASSNQIPVPTGFVVRKVFFNRSLCLWQRYLVARSAILASCKSSTSSLAPFTAIPVATGGFLDTDSFVQCDPLAANCNEWRLMHGCSFEAGKHICKENFDLSLSGTGATWKGPGVSCGTPLYGRHAAYFGERVTKADEYSRPLSEAESQGLDLQGCTAYCMIIARCTAGKPKVLTNDSYDKNRLFEDVLNGPFHSVLGDRCSELGKPYREFTMYDADQIYPEFLVLYERSYGRA